MAQADAERGERIKWLREEKLHLTQEAMADKVGITLRGYQEWEAGGGIKWDNAKKLAKAGGVETDWIMSGDREETTPDLSNGISQMDRIEANQMQILAAIATMRDERAAAEARISTQLRSIARKLGIGSTGSRSRANG